MPDANAPPLLAASGELRWKRQLIAVFFQRRTSSSAP